MGGDVVLIISEAIKEALERMGATGTKFTEVSGPSTISAEERARDRKIRELSVEPPSKSLKFSRSSIRLVFQCPASHS